MTRIWLQIVLRNISVNELPKKKNILKMTKNKMEVAMERITISSKKWQSCRNGEINDINEWCRDLDYENEGMRLMKQW